MGSFDDLLAKHRSAIARYVNNRINVREDAEDVLQDVCITVFQKLAQLKCNDSFRPWSISIAQNKCSRVGIAEPSVLLDTIDKLGEKDAMFTDTTVFRVISFDKKEPSRLRRLLEVYP